MSWSPCINCKLAAGIWNFDGSKKHHLSICVGDLLVVLEELEGWYRGYLYHYPSKKGIFPASYVQPVEYHLISAGEEDYYVPQIDPVALEAKECLYVWKEKLFEHFASVNKQNYHQIHNYIEDVLHLRSTLVRSNAIHDKIQEMKTRLTAKIDQVNNLCQLPLTARDNSGHIIDPHLTSIQTLFTTHEDRENEIKRKVPQTGWDQKKNKDSVTSKDHHLYLVVRHVSHQFPEDCEVFLFLFDNDTKRQISERFLIQVGKSSLQEGFPNKPTSYYCIFKDLGFREMSSSGLYLICQVLRKGKMLLDDKKNVSNHPFRRPYAVGVLDLKPAVDESNRTQQLDDDDDDYQMTYNLPLQICVTNEHDFGTLHLSQIRKSKTGGSKSGPQVSMALKFISGDLQKLTTDFPYLINKSTTHVDKLGFPEVILPGVVRNDIYITVEYGQFEKGHKKTERNVEVGVVVCNKAGNIIPNCIIPAAGSAPLNEYESFIYYHHNQPKWHETFKLSIPYNEIPTCHLRISFRHVAKNEGKDKMEKTFAFAYLKIMKDDGAIFPDGLHELFVYKAESKKNWRDPKVYLGLESVKEMCVQGALQGRDKTGARGKTFSTINLEGSPFAGQSVGRSQREYLFISTLTCSTKLTQKVDMLSLLKWREKPRDIKTILCNIVHLDGEEIVKFLQDTLDSLFNILNENSQYGESVFNALVAIFNLLSEEKYSHFIPVLDIYITKHFSATKAYQTLLWNFNKRLMERDMTKLYDLSILVQSIKFLFHFIIQSYILCSNDPNFHISLEQCFTAIQDLLSTPESRCHGIHKVQGALLRNLPSILVHISKVYNKRQLANILSNVIDSIQNDHPSLPGEKMSFILAVLDCDINLLQPQDARESLFPTLVGHMISHIENKMPDNGYRSDDLGNAGCLDCIGKLLEILHSGEQLHINFSDIENATPLLLPLLSLSKTLHNVKNRMRTITYINLIGLLRVMTENHYAIFFDSLNLDSASKRHSGDGSLKKFITDLLDVLKILVTKSPFFPHWVYMHFTLNSILMKVLKNISYALLQSFCNERDFVPMVWDVYFEVCKEFMIQKYLQLEIYPDSLRAKLIRQFDDVRVIMARHMSAMWHQLKDKKATFIPQWIGLFIEVSLLREAELRQIAIPIIFDIVKVEKRNCNNFKRVETEVFDKMDELISRGYGDEAYRDLFHEIMSSYCSDDEDLVESGQFFVDTVSRLIGLILDYRNVQDDNNYQEQRMGCILNLLNFYKEIEKDELYVRYIYKLAELNEHDANFTEAGLTLLLHAKTLNWALEYVPAVHGLEKYPVESAAKRKEKLYKESIRLLNEGKSWECGIPICKELAMVYETQTYEFQKLAQILQTQADFFNKIITELRVENEYFVVGYYGKAFPLFLRNKVFIHRGQPYERLQAFIKRLTDEFPSAKIYMAADVPNDDIQNSNDMYLQVRKVLPVPEEKKEFTEAEVKISDKITDYYKTNEVCKFRYDRPFHKGKKDPECEFATLWIERTSYITTNSFPGVINWFNVCETKTDELNPLDIARETVSSKNKEIQKLMNDVNNDPTVNVNPLSMSLKGVIDAAVMGGIANYEKIFFQSAYIQEHPDHTEGVDELRKLIKEQVDILRKALVTHGARVPVDLRAFHEDLEMRFESFQDIVDPERRKSRKIVVSTTPSRPLPPTPSAVPSDSSPVSKTKTPHRRLTGANPNRLSKDLEPIEPNQKIKRSYTTKISRGSIISLSPEKQPDTSSSSNGTIFETPTESSPALDEDRGGINDYEVVDLGNPPSYPPPPAPAKTTDAPYCVIDVLDNVSEDEIDDEDYTPVRFSKSTTSQNTSKSNPEFAQPSAVLIGLPKKSPTESRSPSPSRRHKSVSQHSSNSTPSTQTPPISPTRSKLKSSSPSSLDEPIFGDVEMIRAKLRENAARSVRDEIGSPPKPKPYSSNVAQPESKPTHLSTVMETTGSVYDHLPSDTMGTYTLATAEEIALANAIGSNTPVPIVSPLSSTYDVIKHTPDKTPPPMPSRPLPPPKRPAVPTPPRRSPTPPTYPAPPPIPLKKSGRSQTMDNPDYSFTTPSNLIETSNNNISKESVNHQQAQAPVVTPRDRQHPPPIVRPRSQTVDKKSPNYSTSPMPVPLPRKTAQSYSSSTASPDVESFIATNATSYPDSPFTSPPPPRPPKAPVGTKDPPALPPKTKIEAPALPPKAPKPKYESNYPTATSRPARPNR